MARCAISLGKVFREPPWRAGGFEGTPEKLLEIAFVRNNGVGKCFYILRAQVFGSKRAKGEQAGEFLFGRGEDRQGDSIVRIATRNGESYRFYDFISARN